MAKLTLADLSSLTNETSAITTINENGAAIEAALENTLSRDGATPNMMNASLDMNGYAILNETNRAVSETQTNLLDITATINVTNKYLGKMVWDSTNGKPLWAAGILVGSVWVDATGATVHSPV